MDVSSVLNHHLAGMTVRLRMDLNPDIFVAIIPLARSLYDYGVIVSPDHRLLADVSWEGIGLFSEPRQHPAMYELRLPPIHHIAGRVAVITSLKPDNYYHWMFDILPRLSILQKADPFQTTMLLTRRISFKKKACKSSVLLRANS